MSEFLPAGRNPSSAEGADQAPTRYTPSLRVRSALLVPALITFIGLTLRLHLLGEKCLSFDESASATFAGLSWKELLVTVRYVEGNMVLFYVLLRGWMHLGNSEFVLRCLPVFFGVATIPAVYQLGNRFLSRNVGLAGAALLAAHSFHLYSSQFLRGYSLLLFLLVLSTYFFLAAVESPHQRRNQAAYVLTSALAIYAHVFAVLVLVSQWFSLTPSGLRRIGLVRFFWIVAAVGLLVWPVAAQMILLHGQIDWLPRPTIDGLVLGMQMLAGSYSWFTNVWTPRPVAEGYLSLVPYAGFWILAVLGMIYSAGPKSRASTGNPAVRLLILWFVFPIAATLALSVVKPLFHPKYIILCVPAAVLLAGQGISVLSGFAPRLRWIFSVALFFVLALSTKGIAGYYAGLRFRSHHTDWRPVTRYILARQQPGDAALFYINWGPRPYPYLHYVRRELSSRSIADAPPVAFSGILSTEKVDLATRAYKRIWLVLEPEDLERVKQAALIRSALEAHFRPVGEQDFPAEANPGIRVALFAKGPMQQAKGP